MRWSNAKPRVRAANAPMAFINPCLPTKVLLPPSGDRWAHEIKHDGFRVQIHVGGASGPRVFTITGRDWTDRFPVIAAAASKLRGSAIIDAEACVAGTDGVTDFENILKREGQRQAFAYAFDLMMLDGEDWRQRPWLDRRKALKKLLGRKPLAVSFNDHVEGDGPTVYAHACRMGLEGIVSKRIDAPYRSGKSKSWLKIKNPAAPGWTRFK